MKIRKSITSAIAVLGFAFFGTAALANPIAQNTASGSATHLTAAPSAFTLIAVRGGRGGFRAGGFRGGGFRAGGFRGGRAAIVGGGRRGAFVGGRGFAGRRFAGGRRVGYWRNGRWWGPAAVGVGVGVGGSCFWNCRNAGYGPGYCSTYAANFCY